jgi:isopentenyl-diphosphate delta-isomerase
VNRKTDHLRICLNENVQAKLKTSGFEDVNLIHEALPDFSLEEIDTSVNFFGRKLSMPLIISAMTGGTEEAARINASLAEAAEKFKVAMAVGSQRVALEDSSRIYSFRIVREKAPKAFLIANIGCAQLVAQGLEPAFKAVEMIGADALSVHLNALQEAVQLEGEAGFKGALKKLRELKENLEVPIIVKETGAGISAETARRLEDAGIDALDIGGAGGTSWAAVEYYRAREAEDVSHEKLCETFWDWGNPTVISLVEARRTVGVPLIASGGVRSGLDVVKALALGAQCAGVALPFLKPAVKGASAVLSVLKQFREEIRVTAFLIGAKNMVELSRCPLVITGKTAEWLRARGFNPEAYAKREG